MPKLVSGLPKEVDQNGLYALARKAVAAPRRRHVAIVICDCSRITEDTVTGSREATIRVLRLEELAPQDVEEAERLYRRAWEYRNGRNALPIDLEDAVAAAFGDGYRIDPLTGEIIVPDLEPEELGGPDSDEEAER